jgi:hypothetical protein
MHVDSMKVDKLASNGNVTTDKGYTCYGPRQIWAEILENITAIRARVLDDARKRKLANPVGAP